MKRTASSSLSPSPCCSAGARYDNAGGVVCRSCRVPFRAHSFICRLIIAGERLKPVESEISRLRRFGNLSAESRRRDTTTDNEHRWQPGRERIRSKAETSTGLTSRRERKIIYKRFSAARPVPPPRGVYRDKFDANNRRIS